MSVSNRLCLIGIFLHQLTMIISQPNTNENYEEDNIVPDDRLVELLKQVNLKLTMIMSQPNINRDEWFARLQEFVNKGNNEIPTTMSQDNKPKPADYLNSDNPGREKNELTMIMSNNDHRISVSELPPKRSYGLCANNKTICNEGKSKVSFQEILTMDRDKSIKTYILRNGELQEIDTGTMSVRLTNTGGETINFWTLHKQANGRFKGEIEETITYDQKMLREKFIEKIKENKQANQYKSDDVIYYIELYDTTL